MFFIKFKSNIEKFEAEGRELFNITREFNEKYRNPSVSPDGKQQQQGKSRKLDFGNKGHNFFASIESLYSSRTFGLIKYIDLLVFKK